MNTEKLQAVILAAGESSRFWPLNSREKSLIRMMGKPLIWYTIRALSMAGVDNIIVVQSPSRDVENELKEIDCGANINYAIQENALGMGNAILAAKNYITAPFFVMNANRIDCGDVISRMIDCQNKTGAKSVLAGEETLTPWAYGIARLDGDRVLEVIEKPSEGSEPSNINVAGIRLCDPGILEHLEAVAGKRANNDEFEAAISMFAKDYDTRIVIFGNGIKSVSAKYPWQLFKTQKYLFDKFLTQQKIAKSARIAKGAVIEGNVVIGENVKIYEGAVVKGPCYIGDNSVIGNNSVVRDYCDLEEGAVVGAFCEVARTIFQPDVHVHSGYFGDSIFDRGVRIGASAITANVRVDRGEISALAKKEKNGVKTLTKISTGLKSLGVIIGQNSKIGVRATFMPGRFIGKNCFVGPNQLIMHNIDDGAKI